MIPDAKESLFYTSPTSPATAIPLPLQAGIFYGKGTRLFNCIMEDDTVLPWTGDTQPSPLRRSYLVSYQVCPGAPAMLTACQSELDSCCFHILAPVWGRG